MMVRLSDAQVRRLRLRSQSLIGSRPADVAAVVRQVGALQAQATPAARLAVRPRSTGLDAASVTRACNADRSVVRTWAMRGTLHMLPAEDVRWIVGLLGPEFAARSRGRRHQLGLNDDTCARGLRAIEEVLAAGPLPRDEIVRRIADLGVRIDPTGQARPHLLGYAAMRGLLCRGPDQPGDEPTYVLIDDWIPAAGGPAGEAALAELARRHVRGHGPAGPRDLAAWAGITLSRARRALELIRDELVEVEALGEPAWLPAGAELPDDGGQGRSVRLLPSFDAYLLGYAGRDWMLAREFARRIQAGGGMIHPSVVVDGRVAGTWRQRRGARGLHVTVAPFEAWPRPVQDAVDEELADIGRYLGSAVSSGTD
jgi:Winged helix DNA-binding domain